MELYPLSLSLSLSLSLYTTYYITDHEVTDEGDFILIPLDGGDFILVENNVRHGIFS
jgi:hypothetical protein